VELNGQVVDHEDEQLGRGFDAEYLIRVHVFCCKMEWKVNPVKSHLSVHDLMDSIENIQA
jgi:hypothetical protein